MNRSVFVYNIFFKLLFCDILFTNIYNFFIIHDSIKLQMGTQETVLLKPVKRSKKCVNILYTNNFKYGVRI